MYKAIINKTLITLAVISLFSFLILSICYAQTVVEENPNIKVIIDGEESSYSNVPIITNGRTLLPLREILTKLGVQNDDRHIIWSDTDKSVTIIQDNLKICLKIDNTTASVNDDNIALDAPPVIYKDVTYIPARFVSQSLGKNVDWDGSTNSIIITNKIQEKPQTENVAESKDKVVETAAPTTSSFIKYPTFIGSLITAKNYLNETQYEIAKEFIVDFKEENGELKIESMKFNFQGVDYLTPFPMIQSDLVEIISKGFTLRQIYEAYMIGNRVYLSPKKLLDMSRDYKLDLDIIKSEILSYIKEPVMSVSVALEESDLKDLLSKGFEAKDIFKAYILGNRLHVDPKIILQVKRDENKDLTTIENEITAQRNNNVVMILAGKYPKEYEYLRSENMSDNDIITLLGLYGQFNVPSIQILLEEYKNNGFDAVYIYTKYKNNRRGVSQEYIDKYGLTPEDVEGINDDRIRSIESLVKKIPGSTVKQLLEQMQKALRNSPYWKLLNT